MLDEGSYAEAMAGCSIVFHTASPMTVIVSGHNTDLFGMAQILQDRYGKNYPIPKSVMPKWVVWLAGPLANKVMTRKMVSLNIGVPWKADNRKSIRELGVTYRTLKETMNDLFEQLVESGVFQKQGTRRSSSSGNSEAGELNVEASKTVNG